VIKPFKRHIVSMYNVGNMEKRTKLLIVTGIFVLLFVGVVGSLNYLSDKKVYSAVRYLKTHFNESMGLIYESEDEGIQNINGLNYAHDQIYYIYSDNLLAEYALKPYEPQISSKINQTIQSYKIQQSMFYEVLFGKIIPLNISIGVQLVIKQSQDKIIMAEFHNSSNQLSWIQYGDTLIYPSLNLFQRGNRTGAEYYFNNASKMWDGKGIYDLATRIDGKYANYKLALVLYASKILGISISSYNMIKDKLWSMQQSNGGITSLADLNGNPVGSANTETTAIALLC
jgi:hypothetical protein